MNVCGRNGTMLHFAVLNDHTEVLKVTLNQYVNTAFAFCTDLVGQAKATFTLTSTLVNVSLLVRRFVRCSLARSPPASPPLLVVRPLRRGWLRLLG